MELRAFAEQVLYRGDLEAKTEWVAREWTDANPGAAVRVEWPEREPKLAFAGRDEAPDMPKPRAFADPANRAIAHHLMANHELQALEVMAMVLLAFPEMPFAFRSGLADIMCDEQKHTRMHAQRCRELGTEFGDLPVNGFIWRKSQEYESVLDYLCGLPLVFEGRNLDHSLEFERFFLDVGDKKSAAIMRVIHEDEIDHVRFGVDWVRQLKPPEWTVFETWRKHLKWPVRPSFAKGRIFQEEARQAAGLPEDFIDQLREWTDDKDALRRGGSK